MGAKRRAEPSASSTRSQVVSSFSSIKGSLVTETYAVFSTWQFELSKKENLDRLRENNTIGASSATWLRDVAKVLNRRFEPAGRDRALVVLAQRGCDLEIWKPILLWHMTRDEFLLRDFLVGWLYPAYEQGALRVSPEDIFEYLRGVARRGGVVEHEWTESTLQRVAAGLLRIAADFGLVEGSRRKEFRSYHLPEQSFLYLLHALRDELINPAKVIGAEDWKMFLLDAGRVEQQLLQLHQFRQLDYQAAGSLVQLTLRYPSALAFAEGMVS